MQHIWLAVISKTCKQRLVVDREDRKICSFWDGGYWPGGPKFIITAKLLLTGWTKIYNYCEAAIDLVDQNL